MERREDTKMYAMNKRYFHTAGPSDIPPENRASRRRTAPKQNNLKLEKVSLLPGTDTPILNNIPDNIETTDEIDYAIGALTNHIATVIEDSSRRSRRPTVAENYRRRSRTSEAKNAAMRRASHIRHAKIGPVRELST
ncbi:hypothetical protein EVAR_20443_1 [Eumeta japonica]|uniref:Uncharacterized protein n=1 Tax=Eumeta variegata TaxID=151549 RepID=A0A4C1TXX5_EUMVA|nr:hypothetical protein EVAR_20443_1 [Eumeta japonica]